MKLLPLVGAVTLFAVLAHTVHALKNSIVTKNHSKLDPTTSQGLEGGFWRTDGNFNPILRIKNALIKQPLDVTPSLFFADGAEYKLPSVHLDPAGVASVDLKLALGNVPPAIRSHISDFGMASVSYRWSWPAILATIQNTDEIASLSGVSSTPADVNAVHHSPEEQTAHLIRGTWWRATKSSEVILALGNSSMSPKQLQIALSDHLGNPLVEKNISLGKHATVMLRLSDLPAVANSGEESGDISIKYIGPSHGIVASGSVEDSATGYSAIPHLFELRPDPTEAIHQVTLHAPGLMLGKPDPGMLFPTETVFTPYAVLHNISAHPIEAKVSITSDSEDGKPSTRALDQVSLAAGQSMKLPVDHYFGSENSLPNGYGHLSVAFQGRNEDLIFDAGSVDQSGSYVFQVMPAAEVPTISKIFCLWSVEGDTSSMISIWNYASKPQDATLTLYYSGGQYRIPLHLEPRKTYNLDTMTLMHSRVPDADGNLIPEYITSGSAMLTGPGGPLDKMTVVASASVYNVRNATCFPVCTNCNGLVSLETDPDIAQIYPNGSVQGAATATTFSGSTIDVTGGSTWSTVHPTIASVSAGMFTGHTIGSTNYSAEFSAPSGTYQCYENPGQVCADEAFGGGGTAAVASLSCTSSVIRGGSATCTVSGATGEGLSGWKFTDASGNTVTRTTNTASSTWSGMIVTSGTVTVNISGSPFTANVTVLNRTNFAFTAANPTQVMSNSITCYRPGESITLQSPPINDTQGASCPDQAFSYVSSAPISDGGPNQGYQFVISASSTNGSQPTKFEYIVVSDLLSTTPFYNAQCGTFSSSNSTGFIAGSQLKLNVLDHEQGSVLSHWTEYRDAQNNSSNNIGTSLESVIAPPGTTPSAYQLNLNSLGTDALDRIDAAVAPEPCGGSARKDSSQSCKSCGAINFSPYVSCGGTTPVAHCQ